MDEENVVKELDLEEFLRPVCPVKVGDRIYRKIRTMTVPDRMEVIEVIPTKEGYNIKIRYMYHVIGPQERIYSDKIFQDEDWVIERKGVDF